MQDQYTEEDWDKFLGGYECRSQLFTEVVRTNHHHSRQLLGAGSQVQVHCEAGRQTLGR